MSSPKRSGSSSGGGTSGFGGAPGAAIRARAARGASYVTATSGRETAILLIIAILLARLVLTQQLQGLWAAVWGQSRPLGQGLPMKVAAGSGAGSSSSSSTGSKESASASGVGKPPSSASGTSGIVAL